MLNRTTTVARRLALRLTFLGGILAIATLAVLVPLERMHVYREAVSEGHLLAEAIAALYQSVDRPEEMEQAGRLLLKVARAPDVAYVNVLSPKGRVLFSTQAIQLGRTYILREDVQKMGGLLGVTHLLPAPLGPIGGVTVGMDLSAIYSDYNRFDVVLALAFLVVVIWLTLLMLFFAERMVGSRLARLGDVIENAEKGSFLVRAKIDHMDEIGVLAQGLNRLLAAITNLQAKQIESEQDLEMAQRLKISNQNLERRVRAQELLMEAANHLGGILNKSVLVHRLVALVRDKMGWPDFAVFLMNGQKSQEQQLRLTVASGLPNVDVIRELSFRLGEGITGLVAQTAAPMIIDNVASEPRVKVWERLDRQEQAPDFLKNGSMLSVPMLYQGRVVGVMDFFDPKPSAFDEKDVTLLMALGSIVATGIVNADLYEATLELATSDPLTGLLNRRSMERLIDNEINRAQRFGSSLALLMIDVDHFKSYNDHMGHVMGDSALKSIASCLLESVRKVDGVARFGGEEFCVILPQTGLEQAKEVAQKLCRNITQLKIRGAGSQPLGHLSISVGVSVYPYDAIGHDGADASLELLRKADAALYDAKKAGRNRVVASWAGNA